MCAKWGFLKITKERTGSGYVVDVDDGFLYMVALKERNGVCLFVLSFFLLSFVLSWFLWRGVLVFGGGGRKRMHQDR